jgi:hypothetical protein
LYACASVAPAPTENLVHRRDVDEQVEPRVGDQRLEAVSAAADGEGAALPDGPLHRVRDLAGRVGQHDRVRREDETRVEPASQQFGVPRVVGPHHHVRQSGSATATDRQRGAGLQNHAGDRGAGDGSGRAEELSARGNHMSTYPSGIVD